MYANFVSKIVLLSVNQKGQHGRVLTKVGGILHVQISLFIVESTPLGPLNTIGANAAFSSKKQGQNHLIQEFVRYTILICYHWIHIWKRFYMMRNS